MPHRHYGLPVYNARPTRAAAWSSGAINVAMIVIVVVLGLILFELSMTTASAPATMDQRSDAPAPSGMAR
jgi:hypothetical protein